MEAESVVKDVVDVVMAGVDAGCGAVAGLIKQHMLRNEQRERISACIDYQMTWPNWGRLLC